MSTSTANAALPPDCVSSAGVPPFEVIVPARRTAPFVYASPHSGTDYTPSFIAASRLDAVALRRSEDSFIDEVFSRVPDHGAPLLKALFPRAFCDPNREAYELDPAMFEDALPDYVNSTSPRVIGGLGTIARVVTDGAEIYHRKLRFAEAEERVHLLYRPYHKALSGLVAETRDQFGYAILIDCHSMPSIGGPMDRDQGRRRPDMVLGDRFGSSCSDGLTDSVETLLSEMGYYVARNNPYAGGYTTAHYGKPQLGVHALQIEINRALYMDENNITRLPGLESLADNMSRLAQGLAEADFSRLDQRS